MFTLVFISIVNIEIWEVKMCLQHVFKDHWYIKWLLMCRWIVCSIHCVFWYTIFFVRLLSVFLKHKINKCASWFCTWLVLWTSSFHNSRNIYCWANVRACSSVRHVDLCCPLSGYILTSVCTHPNAFSLYFKLCIMPHPTINIKPTTLSNRENSRTI